ncbi:MAG: peptidase M48 family protein [Micavibrio aeruginosavorus]|uniref:Peptidase M48 family protein n=1 Tax=Micavibrio aeruginosavorus TaxID=349221 RepID=A0A2W5MQE1_9BACT|nr:MAG: peptidase M48 family protein [Micavibrio aeruginosavorus]
MALGFTAKAKLCKYIILGVALLATGSCTVNPATGENQFTAFLPAGQESSVGASEHENVKKTYGNFVTGPVAEYVSKIGQKVAANTERTDVQYKFYVIDSPIVNAFAVPGGYIYISRGLMALANDEAELAGVIAHEIGHITARHAATRMSQGVLVGLGAAILSAATGSDAVGQVANVGSDLYIKSYSRSQETQADELGVRYLSRAGYDPNAMADFLKSLDAQTKLDQHIAGQSEGVGSSYFSTHPVTADRVTNAKAVAVNYQGGKTIRNRDVYLSMINGITYGDSEEQGFVRGDNFYHPKMGFTFSVPSGFKIDNNPSELIAANDDGAIIILDSGRDDQGRDPMAYLTQNWMKDKPPSDAENVTINGMKAATAAFAGTANGKSVIIRVVAIQWKPGQFFRFQMAIPQNAGTATVEGLKRTTYSFRAMTDSERNAIKPLKVRTFTASSSSVGEAASRMAFKDYKEERFRVLNAVAGNLTAGQLYKVVTE